MNVATKDNPKVIAGLKSQSASALAEFLRKEKAEAPIMNELHRRVAEARGRMNLQQGVGSRGR